MKKRKQKMARVQYRAAWRDVAGTVSWDERAESDTDWQRVSHAIEWKETARGDVLFGGDVVMPPLLGWSGYVANIKIRKAA